MAGGQKQVPRVPYRGPWRQDEGAWQSSTSDTGEGELAWWS